MKIIYSLLVVIVVIGLFYSLVILPLSKQTKPAKLATISTKKQPPKISIYRNAEDSVSKNINKYNYEKIKKLGKYVFEDENNLYKYNLKKVSLNLIAGKHDQAEKLEAILSVKKYITREDTVSFVREQGSIYLKSPYDPYDVGSTKVNLEKQIFLIDLNDDGIKEIIFYSNGEVETDFLCIWAFDSKKNAYYFVKYFGGIDIIEKFTIDTTTNTVFFQYIEYGCCADYSQEQYKYKITTKNGKFEFKRESVYVFSAEGYLFPKKLQRPKTTILDYTSHIYSKPVIRDSKIPDNIDSFTYENTYKFVYTYFIGEIPKGTTITELATYTNPKGEKWRFVVLQKGYKPEVLIDFGYFSKDYQIYAWLPPEKYDME